MTDPVDHWSFTLLADAGNAAATREHLRAIQSGMVPILAAEAILERVTELAGRLIDRDHDAKKIRAAYRRTAGEPPATTATAWPKGDRAASDLAADLVCAEDPDERRDLLAGIPDHGSALAVIDHLATAMARFLDKGEHE